MIYASKTDKGMVREKNEDYCYADGKLFIVADGMGGHNAGDVASEMAVSSVVKSLQNVNENFEDEIINAIKKANHEVFSNAIEEKSGMGTTIDVCILHENKIHLGHVGDSRFYIIREKEIKQITEDHSYVEMLLQKGEITKEEAKNYPMKNMITRAVGVNDEVKIDYYKVDVIKKDKILICSDGLCNMLSDSEILNLIENSESPDEAAALLILNANNKGGKDNITVVTAFLD